MSDDPTSEADFWRLMARRGRTTARRRNPEEQERKNNARRILNHAVDHGEIPKPDNCSVCGASGRIEGHHLDYDRPWDVIWLCRRCHRKEPRGRRSLWTSPTMTQEDIVIIAGQRVEIRSRDYWGHPNYRAILPGDDPDWVPGRRCHLPEDEAYEQMPTEFPAKMYGWHRTRDEAIACAEQRLAGGLN